MLAVIIPTYHSERDLPFLFENLTGQVDRVILSDGGSTDRSLELGLERGAVLAVGSPGRGQQLRRAVTLAGAADWLLFLHADSQLTSDWRAKVEAFISAHPEKVGYFDLKFDSASPAARVVEALVRLRCWAWGLPYGDQGLLISKNLYDKIGGFKNMALFEDVDMVTRLGKNRLKRINSQIVTSADKYERDGFFRRGWRNLKLLRRFQKGVPVDVLMEDYA